MGTDGRSLNSKTHNNSHTGQLSKQIQKKIPQNKSIDHSDVSLGPCSYSRAMIPNKGGGFLPPSPSEEDKPTSLTGNHSIRTWCVSKSGAHGDGVENHCARTGQIKSLSSTLNGPGKPQTKQAENTSHNAVCSHLQNRPI